MENFIQNQIRNFCIIAHIDHGKSTLADRFLELTGTVEKRKMKEQFLDQMELERERGITIKLQPVRMRWKIPKIPLNSPLTKGEIKLSENVIARERSDRSNLKKPHKYEIASLLPVARNDNFGVFGQPEKGGFSEQEFILNLIDTPGHIDFNYEVSRSLAAVEGAILLVDATQGIQAQTLGNLYLALEQNLAIIPVVNKIDLPGAKTDLVIKDISNLLGIKENQVMKISAKTGQGVAEVLERVIRDVPWPKGNPNKPLRALVFDSDYDSYKGVIAYVRIVDGKIKKNDKILLMASGVKGEALEVGIFTPEMLAKEELLAGEIGYIATGFKEVEKCRVGDTLRLAPLSQGRLLSFDKLRAGSFDKFKVQESNSNVMVSSSNVMVSSSNHDIQPLPGYKEPKPMVYASIYPRDGGDFDILRDAFGKLKLSDAALAYEPESSSALGRGFRCGFLGLLHLEIISERLRREFNVNLVVTTPSVVYKVKMKDTDKQINIYSPAELPDRSIISEISEPWVNLEAITPKQYFGPVMDLLSNLRGKYIKTDYLTDERIIINFQVPLIDAIIDLHDKLKSASSGYASMNYTLLDWRPADLVKIDILIAGEKVDALSHIVPNQSSYHEARSLVERLKKVIPRQQFDVAIQAAIGGKIIARETVKQYRKDVTGYLYGGDVTRKMKLLKIQKRGKKKMRDRGRINIPQEAFLAVLKRE